MALFVDKPSRWGDMSRLWSHLVSDKSVEELHAFAEKIGLKREWFQDKPGRPHYDICSQAKRRKAIQLGAKEVPAGEIIFALRRMGKGAVGHREWSLQVGGSDAPLMVGHGIQALIAALQGALGKQGAQKWRAVVKVDLKDGTEAPADSR